MAVRLLLQTYVRTTVFALFAVALHAAQIVYQQDIPATAVAVDSSSNVYVAGSSTVTKLDPRGNVVYSKQLNLPDTWSGIAVDALGEVVIAGTTTADNLPTTPGVFQPKRNTSGTCVSGDMSALPIPCPDAFVAKLDANGNVAWATYLGGSAADQANAVAVDSSGNVYVAGLHSVRRFPQPVGVPAFAGRLRGWIRNQNRRGRHANSVLQLHGRRRIRRGARHRRRLR